MEIQEHIEALEEQGALLAGSAELAGLDQLVPTCPEWSLRDLLHHVGDVHRWATVYVATGRMTMLTDDEEKLLFGKSPEDAEMIDWFREGHRALCEALRAAPADLECWSFMAAPSPLAFWARRQAHETTIHRVDAESVSGVLTPIGPTFASDGIDELLRGFAARGGKLLRDPPRTMAVEATDTNNRWFVTLGVESVTTDHNGGGGVAAGAGDSECVVRGKAADLYLALWNRLATSASGSMLLVEGDGQVLDGFCESLRIRWS